MLVATLNRSAEARADRGRLAKSAGFPSRRRWPRRSRGLPDRAADLAPEVAVRKADVAAGGPAGRGGAGGAEAVWTVGGSFFWQGGTDRVVAFTVGVDCPSERTAEAAPADRGVARRGSRRRGSTCRTRRRKRAQRRRGSLPTSPGRGADRPLPFRTAAAVVGGARRRARQLPRRPRRLRVGARRVPPVDRNPRGTRAARSQPVRRRRPARHPRQSRGTRRRGATALGRRTPGTGRSPRS